MDKTKTRKRNAFLRNRPKSKTGILSIFLIVLLLLQGCSVDVSQTQTGGFGKKATETEGIQDSAGLSVHYIDVGQGDATLITCGDASMLIDAGNNNMGTAIQYYLTKQGIERLNYVVGTHPDADHIGGLDVILYKFACDTLFMPDITKDTKTYQEVLDVAEQKQLTVTHPDAGDSYALGDASFTILSPAATGGQDANNSSIVLRLVYKDTSFLFSGDAENEEEQLILDSGRSLQSNVYKAAHHGSSGANMEAYLDAVAPEYAVISCGKDNSYGHPHKEVIDMLKKRGIKTYRTDEQGTIIFYSDGESLSCSQTGKTERSLTEAVPTEGDMVENAPVKTEQTQDSNGEAYILNTNTKKIHSKDCSSVADILEKNRMESSETLSSLIEQGYSPCKRCIGY